MCDECSDGCVANKRAGEIKLGAGSRRTQMRAKLTGYVNLTIGAKRRHGALLQHTPRAARRIVRIGDVRHIRTYDHRPRPSVPAIMGAPYFYLTESGLGESTNLYEVGERDIPGSAEILGRGNGLLVVEVIGSVWCVKRSQ